MCFWYDMRNFKTNRCRLTGRIANRELRAALGIASVNFFTARYLTPLAKAGYISLENPASIHSPLQRYRLQAKGRGLVR